MRSVLHDELGPVRWSLATPDGGLVKTDKSCLFHLLESGTVKKWPGFEASFDARAARTCAAVPFLELSLAVFLLVSFGV